MVINWPKGLDAISTTGRSTVPTVSAAWPEVSSLENPNWCSEAGPEGFYLKHNGFLLGWATNTNWVFSLFLQVGFSEIKQKHIVRIPPKIVLSLSDHILETSTSEWEDVPLGFAGLSVYSSSQQKKMQGKQPLKDLSDTGWIILEASDTAGLGWL